MSSIRRIQWTYYLTLSLFWLGTALPIALSILLVQARGMNLFQIGVLMGIYSATIVLLEVPTGGLADAIGRKRVTVLAYACVTLAGIAFLLAFSFPAFVLVFALNGVSRALASGALDAWFVDALQAADPEVELQPALAKAGTFTLLALGGGTLLGSLIPKLFTGLPAEGTAVFTPFSMTLVFSVGVKLMALLAVIFLVEEDRSTYGDTTWQQSVREMPQIVHTAFDLSRRNSTIMLLLGATVASGLVLASLENFWQPFFANLLDGAADNTVFLGIVMGGNFAVGMVGNVLATPISRRLDQRYALVSGIFQGIRGLVLLALAVQTALVPAAALFWLVYLNMGVVNSPHMTLLNLQIPAQRRSSMLSVESLVSYVGSIVGSVGLGYVAEHVSIGAAWKVAGVVLLLSVFMYLRIDAIEKEQESQDALVPETR